MSIFIQSFIAILGLTVCFTVYVIKKSFEAIDQLEMENKALWKAVLTEDASEKQIQMNLASVIKYERENL